MSANIANVAATRALEEIRVGDELPQLAIEMTPTLIVSTAIASRDYQDVHHDPDLARQRGSRDIFMNILTTNGLVGRYVTDWTGPDVALRDVSIRLGAPNHPQDTMTMTGDVITVDSTDGIVEIRVRGDNQLGAHVVGTVTVEFPVPGTRT